MVLSINNQSLVVGCCFALLIFTGTGSCSPPTVAGRLTKEMGGVGGASAKHDEWTRIETARLVRALYSCVFGDRLWISIAARAHSC